MAQTPARLTGANEPVRIVKPEAGVTASARANVFRDTESYETAEESMALQPCQPCDVLIRKYDAVANTASCAAIVEFTRNVSSTPVLAEGTFAVAELLTRLTPTGAAFASARLVLVLMTIPWPTESYNIAIQSTTPFHVYVE